MRPIVEYINKDRLVCIPIDLVLNMLQLIENKKLEKEADKEYNELYTELTKCI